jgi:hypothetical protein
MARSAQPHKPTEPVGPGVYVLAWLFGLVGVALFVWWALMVWGASR